MLRNFPQVGLHLSGGSTEHQLAALRSRAVDAVVLTYRSVLPREDLRIDVLPMMRSGFVCRRQHPLVQQRDRRLEFKDLTPYPMISTRVSDDVTRMLVERHGSQANPKSWLHVSSDEIGALIEAVRDSDSIFLGVLAATRSLLKTGEFVELRLHPITQLHAQFTFITLEGRTEAPPLQLVREFCAELARAEAEINGK
jgi:DNA-binding transcriptional LysR family regulator